MATCLKCNDAFADGEDSPFCPKHRPKGREEFRSAVAVQKYVPQNAYSREQARMVMELVHRAFTEGYATARVHADHPDLFKDPEGDAALAWMGSDVVSALTKFI